jgi:hypothetical protein
MHTTNNLKNILNIYIYITQIFEVSKMCFHMDFLTQKIFSCILNFTTCL